MSARKQLAAHLNTALGRKVYVLDVEDEPDALSRPTCIVRFHSYEPAPNALGSLFATFIVTIASHYTDRAKAEDALDALLPDITQALAGIPGLTWTRANKALLAGKYLAFDIDATLPVDVL